MHIETITAEWDDHRAVVWVAVIPSDDANGVCCVRVFDDDAAAQQWAESEGGVWAEAVVES